ncbi:endocuticle structural glycoprotein SgAbd-3-like [Pectinophora gossypiella]|uniref:endocuticle structural glycoprotein SgAbd-3-like n=1 Tax=Pectinophora gossypiella TaxID=13191 RepID=UPI00214E13E8|nr:endocuticle structural glycoprotein SgAbd-3-like [Pectinophora gossypiella]
MKYFIVLALASVAASARLDGNVYLPPHSRSSGGASAGLQAPFSQDQSQNYQGQSQNYAQGQNQNYAQGQNQNQAEILKYENEITEDGFHYAYETSDGTKAEQEGRVLPGAKPEEGSLQVSGSYSYVGDDGQTYTVTYTADENGFQPQGAHLPTPPPIPEAILKSLQLTAGNGAQYNSGRSSYDADNGY